MQTDQELTSFDTITQELLAKYKETPFMSAEIYSTIKTLEDQQTGKYMQEYPLKLNKFRSDDNTMDSDVVLCDEALKTDSKIRLGLMIGPYAFSRQEHNL